MKVEVTDILDLTEANNSSKVLVMDQILEYFAPLFFEEIEKKQRRHKENLNEIQRVHSEISETNSSIEKLTKLTKRQLVISQILEQVKKQQNTLDKSLLIQVVEAVKDRSVLTKVLLQKLATLKETAEKS